LDDSAHALCVSLLPKQSIVPSLPHLKQAIYLPLPTLIHPVIVLLLSLKPAVIFLLPPLKYALIPLLLLQRVKLPADLLTTCVQGTTNCKGCHNRLHPRGPGAWLPTTSLY
jgi:hypothetical protein